MRKRAYPKNSPIYLKIESLFHGLEGNTGPVIAETLGITLSSVYATLNYILEEKDDTDIPEPESPKTTDWKRKQEKKLIKALKAYNDSVPKEEQVPI